VISLEEGSHYAVSSIAQSQNNFGDNRDSGKANLKFAAGNLVGFGRHPDQPVAADECRLRHSNA